MSRIFVALIFAVILFSCTKKQQSFIIENDVFSKTFIFSDENADKIQVEIQHKELDEKIAETEDLPFFEFVIKNKLVTANDKLWVFKAASERKMGNGGVEHTLVFEGVKAPVEGLQVVLFQQVFAGSSLMREKLELRSEHKSFELNKLEDQLHFKFPAYTIECEEKNRVESTEIRMASFEKRPITFGNKQKGNHMYYPDIIQSEVTNKITSAKGPISILSDGKISWLTAYEHASQDDLSGMFDKQKLGEGNLINDAMQGTKGVFNFPILEDDFKFIGISSKLADNDINVSVDILRGGYLEGEIIDAEHPYATVWTATGFYKGNNLEDGKAMLRNYLFNQICEKPASRIPEFYYNTWGMQRNDKTKPLRGILTYNRIFEEIDYAAELGVDIFVLDDGWENTQGEWFPHTERLNKGLAPIKKKLDEHGMKMGLWYSPMGIDSTTQSYKEHPDWVIKDSEGNPIMAQWNHPAFDFVGGFFDVFVADCKKMIDQGCRFMKWDAINTFYSSLPNLEHGSDKYSKEERRARYEYLLPIYVTRAMEILTDYEPELVIEMDLTEARRVMVGLAPLSQGKLFWMNNGASWYNDYTTFRTQSMRTIANEFAGIIPLELFTYANYPHNVTGNMKYNVNNSLLCGHGFWGNLEIMNSEERKWIGEQVKQSKKVLPYLVDINPEVTGVVGDSPEIYSIVNKEEAAGMVILFSDEASKTDLHVDLKSENMLAILNQPYSQKNKQLHFSFELENGGSCAAIVLPNNNSGISITSSSSQISSAEVSNNKLIYIANHGQQKILTDKKLGKPVVNCSGKLELTIEEKEQNYEINIVLNSPKSELVLEFEK
jgi:hypothetical protein